jgi:hypothetical protein
VIQASEYEWNPGDYDPSEPTYPTTAVWRNGDVGNEDWERYNSQLTHEWLRFYERANEFIGEQCRKHRTSRAPDGWLEIQRLKFRRVLALNYAGQTEPDPRWIEERYRRILARKGSEAADEFTALWRQHSPARFEQDAKMRQAGER